MPRQTESPRRAACENCGGPVVDTAVGFTHVDSSGALAGWLCPTPHLSLARPNPSRHPTPIPATPRHSRPEPPERTHA